MRKQMIIGMLIAALCMFLPYPLSAEEVFLRNQDKISGSIIKEDDKSVTLETEAMGQLVIKKEFIEKIASRQPEVVAVKDDEEESRLWQREILLGYNKSNGNTKNAQLSFSLNANRKTDHNEFTIKGNNYYSSFNKKMTTQQWTGMIRYAYSFWDREWYNFYKVEGAHDRFANIDYRIVPSSGIGYWFSDEPDWKAMIEGAFGLEYTNFRDDTKETDDPVFISRAFLKKKVFRELTISEDISIYPSLTDLREYRLRSEASFVNPINDQFALRVDVINDYNANPSENVKKMDTRLMTSLQYSF